MGLTTRQSEILKECTNAPKTVYELAELFETHPQTLRREIWELQRQGLIAETVFRKNKAKRWVSVIQTQVNAGTHNLIAGGTSMPPVALIEAGPVVQNYLDGMSVMAELPKLILSKILQEYGYKRGWALPHEKFGDVGFPSVAQTRNLLHRAIPLMHEFAELLEAIDNMLVWEDPAYTVMLYGQRDVEHDEELWEKVRENIRRFGELINARGWDSILEPKVLEHRMNGND